MTFDINHSKSYEIFYSSVSLKAHCWQPLVQVSEFVESNKKHYINTSKKKPIFLSHLFFFFFPFLSNNLGFEIKHWISDFSNNFLQFAATVKILRSMISKMFMILKTLGIIFNNIAKMWGFIYKNRFTVSLFLWPLNLFFFCHCFCGVKFCTQQIHSHPKGLREYRSYSWGCLQLKVTSSCRFNRCGIKLRRCVGSIGSINLFHTLFMSFCYLVLSQVPFVSYSLMSLWKTSGTNSILGLPKSVKRIWMKKYLKKCVTIWLQNG